MPNGTAGGSTFATLLRALRERAGLTQEELAERAGLTPHAVSALERGTRTRPYPHTVRSLARALDVGDDERAAMVAAVPSRGGARAASGPPQDTPAAPTGSSTTGSSRVEAPAPAVPLRHGLAVPPTRLFGRDADVAAVVGLVRGGARLVTLTGPGGVGKTRLAAAVSDHLAADVPDGVVQVPLVPLTDPATVVPTIGRALGLVGTDGADAVDAVVEHLRHRYLLLVLDNFEHLLGAAPDVGLLVSGCPHLAVVVTSRAPLRLRGEHEHVVAPLELPVAGVSTADELAGAPAGALLLDRARAAAPRLATGPDDVRAMADVCRRLAGLPLAIELVTARLRLLTPVMLLDRLDEVGAAAAARDLPERQRTMRATLDWSHELLSGAERTLFRVLGVFRAGATLEAVEQVASEGAGVPRGDVLGLLAALVEHSLVVVRTGADGLVRYEMLEPVAQYARSLLTGEELLRTVRSHAAHYLDLAERAAPGYERDEQVVWLARTEAEESNLLAAVDRSLDGGDPVTAGRITWLLWLYWWLRGQVRVGRATAERCLDTELPVDVRGRVLLTAATMSFAGGDVPASERFWAEALRLGEQERDPELAGKALAGTGLAAMAAGDLAVAAERFRACLPTTREAGDAGAWLRSLVHVWSGTVLLHLGDPEAAVAETERGLLLARDRGDRLSTYVALYGLSQAAVAGGRLREARSHLEEGIRLSEQTQDMANLAYFLDALAVVEAAEGEAARVAVLLGAAQAIRETVGSNVYGYYLPDLQARDAAAAAALQDLGQDAYEDAVDTGRASEPAAAIAHALRRR